VWRPLPYPVVASLSRIMRHLCGEPALPARLDRHPGLPRLTARAYVVLYQLSARSAVVTTLGESGARSPDPPGPVDYLPPRTDEETLASLFYSIEALLSDDRAEDAGRLADAAAAVIRSVLPRAAELDPPNPATAGEGLAVTSRKFSPSYRRWSFRPRPVWSRGFRSACWHALELAGPGTVT
jgi:hypothetical protein